MREQQRVFTHLHKLRVSMSGWLSLAHRFSGLMLFFSIPLLTYLLQLSLQDRAGFERVRELLESPVSIIAQFALVFFLTLHLLSGLRRLLQDMTIGLEQRVANLTARWVFLLCLLLSCLFLLIRLI